MSQVANRIRQPAPHDVVYPWHVGEASNSHAVWEPTLNGHSDKVGREECQRDRHIDFADAAALASRDAFRGTKVEPRLRRENNLWCGKGVLSRPEVRVVGELR
jgi:hypothetical protein